MKKIFHIPLLQCCRPFRLKETQTEVSYLAGNLNNLSESVEYVPKDSTSYSLEYDTSIQNNSSCNITFKNNDPDPNSCGRCTKCLLVNLDKRSHANDLSSDYFRPTINKFNLKDDLILNVELDNRIPSQCFVKNKYNTPAENDFHLYYHNTFAKYFQKAIEYSIFVEFESVILFYFKTSLIMINNFQSNAANLLNFTQALHLRKITQNIPISIHSLIGYLSYRCILISCENQYLHSFNEPISSKTKTSKKLKILHRSVITEIQFDKPISIKHRKLRSQTFCKVKIKSNHLKNPKPVIRNLNVLERKLQKNISTPSRNTSSIKLNSINKCEEYKDFLEVWKLRRSKANLLINERKDSNTSIMTNSTIVAKSPDTQTRDFMMKYIRNQFKNKPFTLQNSQSVTNSCRTSLRKLLYERNSKKPFTLIKDQSTTSRNRIIEILVEIIYDKVIILMVDKLMILSYNFDEFLLDINSRPRRSSYEDSTDSYASNLQSNCNDNFINTNQSISSTSNTGDFTESTAFDIISDQAYSENSDCPLST